MGNFLQNLNYKIQNMMHGRYGADGFSNFLSIAGLFLLLLSSAFSVPLFYVLAVLAIGYSFFRMFSKNIEKRRAELTRYLNKKSAVMKKIAFKKELHEMKKTHRLYKCKNCKTILRVPKGVGKIKITCAKCKTTMIKHA